MLIYTEPAARGFKRPFFDVRRNDRQPLALSVLRDPRKTRVLFDGGARSGKTDLTVAWMLARAMWYPKSRQIILRKNRNQCHDAIWMETLGDLLEKFIPSRYFERNQEDMAVNFWNGSRLECDGCDDEKRVRRIFGREFLTMFFNEATEFQFGVVDQLQTRVVQRCENEFGLAVPKIILDTNPRGPSHWLHRWGVEGIHPDTDDPVLDRKKWARLGGWTPYDNVKNLSPDAISVYEAMQGVTRRQMLDGEWCSNQGLVYQEFDFDRHCVNRPRELKGKYQCRSIDFGYRDPFVCLWGNIGQDGELTIFDSIYRRNMLVSDHAARIKEKSAKMDVRWTVADHDAEDSATLKREGVRTRRAKKHRPIRAGIELVKKRFAENRLFVTKNCKQVISELQSYSWEDDEVPEDDNNHALDALRYMVAELDGKGRSMAISY